MRYRFFNKLEVLLEEKYFTAKLLRLPEITQKLD